MAFVEDYAPFLTDFGIAATVGGVAITAIFDNGYADAFGIVSGSAPVLLCSSASVSAATVGAAVSVNATSYTVREIQPDGVGMTRLLLQEA